MKWMMIEGMGIILNSFRSLLLARLKPNFSIYSFLRNMNCEPFIPMFTAYTTASREGQTRESRPEYPVLVYHGEGSQFP
jgi:hypothetical protein